MEEMVQSDTGTLNRRALLRVGLQATALGMVAPKAPMAYAAPGSSAGRAVVCIYLFGGNDSNNVLVPLSQYGNYSAARASLALTRESLLPVTDAVTGNEYGFHPDMKEVADLFSSRVAGVVANVGRIRGPLANGSAARAEFNSMTYLDSSLQYLPGGYAAPGWARGLVSPADAVTGFSGIHGASGLSLLSPGIRGSRAHIVDQSAELSRQLLSSFPATGIGRQLGSIAGAIAVGSGTQVFLAQMGGFDTRSNQLKRQGDLLRDLSQAMGAFYQSTLDLGIAGRVVTYTDTEFSRTLASNAKGGSERGWGGHHIVMGGAVIGGQVYGEVPTMAVGTPGDVTGSGVWLPAVSHDTYSEAFAGWLGIPSAVAGGPGLNFLA